MTQQTFYDITVSTPEHRRTFFNSNSSKVMDMFEDLIIDKDINEPYVYCVSYQQIVVGFTYDPDTFVTLSPVPSGYAHNIHQIVEKINYRVDCDSVS